MDTQYVAVIEPGKVNLVDRVRECAGSRTGPIDTLGIFRNAVSAGQQQHKAVAVDVGYEPDYWSRVLKGERGITIDRLGRLPIEVQRAAVISWGATLGLRLERRSQEGQRAALEALAGAALALARGL